LNCQLLAVTPDELTFSDFGESKTVTVSVSNTSWEFVDYPEWITISPSSGSTSTTVTVTATQNTSADLTRTCVFYLKSTGPTWEYKAYVSATQKSAEEYIKLAPSALSFDAAVSMEMVEVDSNVKWNVKCSETWVTLSKSETSFEVKVAENITESVRNASIMVYGGNVTEYVTITQQANGISCSVDKLEFSQNGGTLDFAINSATSWTTKSSNSWIHVSPEKGTAGQNTLSVTVDRNELSTERYGFVYLQVNSKTIAQVSIVQNGVYLNTDVSSLSFSPRTESKSLSLSCNVNWSISSSASWIHISDKNGTGDCIVTVSVDENISDEERSGELIIQSSEGEIVKYIEIQQAGIPISTEVASLHLPYTGKAQNLNIDVNASWSVVSQYDWLSFSPTSGTYNDKVIAVSAEENDEATERTASFSINASGYSKEVNVIQDGKYFNVNSSALSVSASASKVSLSIKTTETWETEVSDSWLSTSPSSGDGNADILISVAANNMAEPRSGKVIFKPADGRQIVINVTQKGMTLNINPDTITFDYKGTAQLINVDTDGEFSVTSNASWIIIDQVYANGFQVSAEMNETATMRSGTVAIQIKNSSMVRTLYVTQKGMTLNINPDTITFDYKGTAQLINVDTDGEFSVTSNASWIIIDQVYANGFQVSAEMNETATMRSGTVVIQIKNSSIVRTLYVIQKGMTLNINPDTITFDYKGTAQLINVDTDGEFSVTSNASWIIIDQVYANGFQVSAEMNETATMRSGTVVIQIKNSSMVRTLYVTQDKEADEANNEYTQQTFTVQGVSFTMIPVMEGTFSMGATSEQQNPDSDENPIHQVTLSSYYIGETEVTQALWMAVMGANPSYFEGDNRPVERVSWNACQTFINKLNALTGKNFRLPTEAEWEYAARGGRISQGYQYSGSNNVSEVAWYTDDASQTCVVKTKAPNELGIYDMSGNVWEWCQDWYSSSSYNSEDASNPQGPTSGSKRVSRGASWYDNAWSCRSARRNPLSPSLQTFNLGLRLAL
jgi:formylglycine-generating enzyme required for sulfatase activity